MRFPSLRTFMALAWAGWFGACGDSGGDSGGDGPPGGTPPDVAARYNVVVAGTTGCDGASNYVTDWAAGPLTISGSADALEFDFGDGVVLSGAVDGSWSWRCDGDATLGSAALAIGGSGTFVVDPDSPECDRWLMDGEFEVEVDDDEFETNNCTVSGPIQAYEITDCAE